MDFKEWSSKNKCELSLNNGDVLQIEVVHEDGKIALAVASVYKAKGNKLTKADYRAVIEKMVSMNPNTLGSGLWLEYYTYDSGTKYFGPYVYKAGNELVYTEDYETEDVG